MTQKTRGVGNVTVRMTDGQVVVMADLPDPLGVRDRINETLTEFRSAQWERERQVAAAGAATITVGQAAPAAGPTSTVAGQLKELAELRDQGILTEEEFAAQKARLLA